MLIAWFFAAAVVVEFIALERAHNRTGSAQTVIVVVEVACRVPRDSASQRHVVAAQKCIQSCKTFTSPRRIYPRQSGGVGQDQ